MVQSRFPFRIVDTGCRIGRGMNMLFEGLKKKGSRFMVPSSAMDTMNLLGAIGGLASLAKSNETPASYTMHGQVLCIFQD